jgi:hypothetical protein
MLPVFICPWEIISSVKAPLYRMIAYTRYDVPWFGEWMDSYCSQDGISFYHFQQRNSVYTKEVPDLTKARSDINAEASVWFTKGEFAPSELRNYRKLKLTSIASTRTWSS